MSKKKLILIILVCVPLIFLLNSSETPSMPKTTNSEISKDEWMALAEKDKVAFTEKFFNALHGGSMDLVDVFYHPKAHFSDPIGEHFGTVDIKKYYAGIYGPVTEISFEFKKPILNGNDLALEWIMTFKSKKLNGGENIVVPGLSKISFDPTTNQALEHRDYFDMGSMVYEQIPVFGSVVRWIKNSLKSH